HALRVAKATRTGTNPVVRGPPTIVADRGRDILVHRISEVFPVGRAEKDEASGVQGSCEMHKARVSIQMKERVFQYPGNFVKGSGVQQAPVDIRYGPAGLGADLDYEHIGKLRFESLDESNVMGFRPGFRHG